MANALVNETSPYLKQHAHNPVAWMPWSEASWAKARAENKLVLVSIGYAACHWCHVMERESFENADIATVMNQDFICLKVDREERPDVDQVYMEAVQLLSGHGGWPLNCFCLPDGRPVYGGTYFQPQQWKQLLQRLTVLWGDDKESLLHQANQLTGALNRPDARGVASEKNPVGFDPDLLLGDLQKGMERSKLSFDRSEGGTQRAPKFPLPVNWRFLLRYALTFADGAVLKQVQLTLGKMADGGIHDQIGGGFARYSVDAIWKIPHFEKMLYDNAQLLALYAQAYAGTGHPRWREVALATARFMQADLGVGDGLYHASLDADSEGVEGLFYVWSKEELQEIIGADFTWFADWHGIDDRGYWEEERYVLLHCGDAETIATRHKMGIEDLLQKDAANCEKLRLHREKRIHPGLDNKVLVSWNALALGALAEAGLWLKDPSLIDKAAKGAEVLLREAVQADGSLRRSRQHGQFAIAGFLEDYALLAWALLQLHRATQETHWVYAAEALVNYAEVHFSDAAGELFFYTSDLDTPLVARKMELQDNVLPSSNGIMARCLVRLSELLDKPEWRQRAENMLVRMAPEFGTYLLAHGGWADLALDLAAPHYVVSVLGPDAVQGAMALAQQHIPQATVVAEVAGQKSLPCLQGQDAGGRNLFVVCRDKTCLAPVTSVAETLPLLPPNVISLS